MNKKNYIRAHTCAQASLFICSAISEGQMVVFGLLLNQAINRLIPLRGESGEGVVRNHEDPERLMRGMELLVYRVKRSGERRQP